MEICFNLKYDSLKSNCELIKNKHSIKFFDRFTSYTKILTTGDIFVWEVMDITWLECYNQAVQQQTMAKK